MASSTIVPFPRPPREDGESAFAGDAAPVRPVRLRGVDREDDLVRAIGRWRPSTTVDGDTPRFALAGRLGQGSQGVVFALKDRDCQRTVALKSMNGREADQDDVARFLHEVQVTAQLEHPGVVPVHDVGVLPDGTLFYTMKRVEGMVLSEWLVGRAGAEAHRFEVLQLFLKLCDTMAFAHSRGVIHRDLKPRNVMVGTYGEVLVMDWGLAKVLGREDPLLRPGSDVKLSPAADHETMEGTAVGTPAYMSPEQARGDLSAVDHRADVYALGILLYEMLANASPYVRGDIKRTVRQVIDGQWTPLDAHAPMRNLPRRLVAVVHKAMALRPEDRYQHVSAIAADLRAYIAGEAVSAHHETTIERLARLFERHRRGIRWTSAGIAALLAVLAGLLWWQSHRDDRQVDELRIEAARAAAAADWAAARAASERILAYRPEDREAQQSAVRFDERQRSQGEQRVKDETRSEFERRQRARAEDLRVRAAAAAAAGRIESFAEAADLCNQARILRPDDRGIAEDHARYLVELSRMQVERTERQRQADAVALRRSKSIEMAAKAEQAAAAGQTDDAIAQMLSAIELEPDPARAERLGALVSQRLRQREDEQRRLREDEQRAAGERRRSEADQQLTAARERLAAGDPPSAQACLARAEALVPAHPDLPELRARITLAQAAAQAAAAEQRIRDADAASRSAEALRVELSTRSEDVRRLRSELGEAADPSRRSLLAAAEDACRDTARQRAQRLAEAVGLLNRALAIAPEHPPVRAALATFWVDRLREAEHDGDLATAAAAEAQARAFDDGANRSLLDGLSQVVNRGSGELLLTPIARSPDRTDVASGTGVRVAVGATASLQHGRYLAANADGSRLAVRLERGAVHELAPPSCAGGLHPGAMFIPGGGLLDQQGRVSGLVRPFAMMQREVTCAEWLEFINDPVNLEAISQALERGELIYVPRSSPFATDPLWRRRGFNRRNAAFALETAGEQTVAIEPACPIALVSHDDAVAYAAWRARRDGRPWRLPTVAEWQFAVQGGDGRAHPWGDADDLSFCASSVTAARDPTLATGGGARFPADLSVQGVWDLAGSRSEFCSGVSGLSPELRPLMGGSFMDRMPDRFTAWSRRDVDRRLVHPGWGVRLVYTP